MDVAAELGDGVLDGGKAHAAAVSLRNAVGGGDARFEGQFGESGIIQTRRANGIENAAGDCGLAQPGGR